MRSARPSLLAGRVPPRLHHFPEGQLLDDVGASDGILREPRTPLLPPSARPHARMHACPSTHRSAEQASNACPVASWAHPHRTPTRRGKRHMTGGGQTGIRTQSIVSYCNVRRCARTTDDETRLQERLESIPSLLLAWRSRKGRTRAWQQAREPRLVSIGGVCQSLCERACTHSFSSFSTISCPMLPCFALIDLTCLRCGVGWPGLA